jgi:SAM-dependent methyltransferase
MTASRPTSPYALGYTNTEHDRLIRQAARIALVTERLFREAGIGPGQRVLDLGSGMGDVAILAARVVGPSGEVMGIERDAISIARANARVAEAGLSNVRFTQTDVNQIVSDKPFDAAVGRFQEVGLPAPSMHMEMPLGSDADFAGLIYGLLESVRPLAQRHNLSLEALGDFDTLPDRTQAEIAASNTVVSFVPMLGAWSRKSIDA